jgi:hypothetical protein
MAKEGVLPAQGRMFGPAGNAQLQAMSLSDSYTTRVKSLRDPIELYDREVAMLEQQIQPQLWGHRGYLAIQAINGIGPTIAAILAGHQQGAGGGGPQGPHPRLLRPARRRDPLLTQTEVAA